MKKITVLGLGYVGLPTACIFAEKGFKVSGFDIDKTIINNLKQNKYNSEEFGLNKLLKKVLDKGSFKPSEILEKADIYIICVPTPLKDSYADLSYLNSSIKAIAKVVSDNSLIIIESTIPIGTTSKCKNLLLSIRSDLKDDNIFFSHCPERVLPGNAIYEIKNNNRVIGGVDEISTQKALELYRSFTKGEIFKTNSNTAEMIKLSENTFRDVNIALANELAEIAEISNININEVVKYANKHPRVNIHNPGIGVGGHCIPIDPLFLIENSNRKLSIIKSSRQLNLEREKFIFNKILKYIQNSVEKKSIYLYGLSYKPNVGDFRESPAMRIAMTLSKCNIKKDIFAIDPYLKEEFNKNNISFLKETYYLDNSLMFILVDHKKVSKSLENITTNHKNFEVIYLTK